MTGFTLRECAIAACLLDRMTSKEAAQAIGITHWTIDRSITRLMSRFGVTNRRALALVLEKYA